MSNLIQRATFALVAACCLTGPVAACPLCKQSIPEATDGSQVDHDPDRLANAYNYSIFAFLGMPVVLGGTVGLLIWRANRNALPSGDQVQ
jgi:hypothetical protein